MLFNCSSCIVVYSAASQGHISLPATIPQDVELLRLHRNNFVRIDTFPLFPNLTELQLNENQLEAFPNLTNVGSTLTKLNLKKNKIRYVDPEVLGSLDVLETLYLEHNHLEHFPDIQEPGSSSLSLLNLDYNYLRDFPTFPNLGATLTSLSVGNNIIRTISDEHLGQLGNFVAKSNPLGSMPRFTHSHHCEPRKLQHSRGQRRRSSAAGNADVPEFGAELIGRRSRF